MRYMYLTLNGVTYFITSDGVARVTSDPTLSLIRDNQGDWRDNDGSPVAGALELKLEAAYKDLQ